MSVQALTLLADVGGTNARFAISPAGSGEVEHLQVFPCDDYGSLEAVAEAYLGQLPGERPRHGVIAVATPVGGDRIVLTNRDWSFSRDGLRDRLRLETLELLNDFAALALSLPYLDEASAPFLRRGQPRTSSPFGLLGPGTGLGVAALVPIPGGGWLPVSTEGGHRDLAASTQREWCLVEYLIGLHGHASAERILSGPGLVELYRALCALDGVEGRFDSPAQIVAAVGEDPQASETLETFADQLGAVAGDLALTGGARAGIFLGGGVLPKMGEAFPRDRFLRRFLAKGRFRDYVEDIPVRLILHPTPALLGLAGGLL